jgi:hypothetical protein
MADYNHLSEAEAIRELARHTEAVKLRFQNLPFRTTSIFITGSMPFIENGHVYNVGFLCEMVQTKCIVKSHYTKRSFHWGITGGDTIQTLIPTVVK